MCGFACVCMCEKERAKSQRERGKIQQQPDDAAATRARYFLGVTRQAGKSGSNNTRNIVESSNVAECRSAAASCPPSPTLFCPPAPQPHNPTTPHPLARSPLASPRLASMLAITASSLFSREHHIHTDRPPLPPPSPLPLTKAPEKPHPRNSSTL